MKGFSNFVLIGTGNLATNLARRIRETGGNILQVYGKSEKHTETLARITQSEAVKHINDITEEADLYILCIPDSALMDISTVLRFNNKPVVHTSGSVSLDAISAVSSKTGVLYLLQTFSKSRQVDFQGIPVFVESTDEALLQKLQLLGNELTGLSIPLNSGQRLKLHLAAVFANNFTNFMITQAFDLMKSEDFPVSYLFPILMETVKKSIETDPYASQTGPARRGDHEVILNHLELLRTDAVKYGIYEHISQTILERYREK